MPGTFLLTSIRLLSSLHEAPRSGARSRPRLPSSLLWGVVLAVAFALDPGPASATMVFSFRDNGGGTTLVTASGSADLTGGTAAGSPWDTFVGWDNFSPAGSNESTSLVADSDFFAFGSPPFATTNVSANATLGTTPLNVDGVNLMTFSGLGLDGTDASYPFFVLRFDSSLPQTGVVSASGSAVLAFDFANLPYSVGESVDLQGNGDVVFQFVPEPGTGLLLATGLFGLAALGRRRAA